MLRSFLALALLHNILAAPISSLTTLPFLPDTPNFDTYSGYLSIPDSGGKQLHYVLVLS